MDGCATETTCVGSGLLYFGMFLTFLRHDLNITEYSILAVHGTYVRKVCKFLKIAADEEKVGSITAVGWGDAQESLL